MSSPGSPDAEGAHHELQQRFTAGLTAAETGTEAPFSTDQVDATLREARENRVTFSADQVEAMVREDRANRDRYSREHAQAIVQEARKLPDAQVGDLTLDEARGTAVGGTRRDAPTPVGERDVINAGVSRVELGLGATTEGEAEVAGRRFQVFFSNELEGSEAARFDAAQASSEGLSPVQQVLRAGEWHHDQRRQPPRQPSLEWPQERPPADVERVHRYAPRAAAEEARRIAVGTHAGHEADTQAQARAPPHAAPRARPSNDGGRSRAGAMAAGAMAAAEAEVEAAVARRQALREEFSRGDQQETRPVPSVSGGGNLQGGQEAFDAAVQRAAHLALEKLGVHGGGARALGDRRDSLAREAMPPPAHLGAASLQGWGERSTPAHLGAVDAPVLVEGSDPILTAHRGKDPGAISAGASTVEQGMGTRQSSLEWPQERPPGDGDRLRLGAHAGREANAQAQERAPPFAATRERPPIDVGWSRASALHAAEAEAEAAVARAKAPREEFTRAEQQEAEPGASVSGVGNLQGGEAFDATIQRAVLFALEKLGVHGGGERVLGEERGTLAREAMPPPAQFGAAPSESWGERSAEGSALVTAAQTQAFAATSALEQKVGVPDVARSHKDANYTHGQYILRRAILLGGNTSNIAPDQVRSDVFQEVLCNLFRNHFRNHQKYNLGYKITTCMVVFTVRVDFVSLVSVVDQFERVKSEDLVSGPVTLDPPLHFEKSSSEGITDAEVYHRCCRRMAAWLTMVYGEEVGQPFATLADETCAWWDSDPSVKLKHFKEVMLEGGRVVQQACTDRLAGENARLRQLGQPTLGANQNSFRHIRDLFTVPNKTTGRPNVESPVAKLSSDHAEGVLPLYKLEHADKLRRAGLAAQVEWLESRASSQDLKGPSKEAQPFSTPAQHLKGPSEAAESLNTPSLYLSGPSRASSLYRTGSSRAVQSLSAPLLNVEGQSKDAPRGDWGSQHRKALTGSHRLTRNEIRRSQRNMPRDQKSQTPLCSRFASHFGCHQKQCPFSHVLPGKQLNAKAQLGLLHRGGSRVAGALCVTSTNVPAARAFLRRQIQREHEETLTVMPLRAEPTKSITRDAAAPRSYKDVLCSGREVSAGRGDGATVRTGKCSTAVNGSSWAATHRGGQQTTASASYKADNGGGAIRRRKAGSTMAHEKAHASSKATGGNGSQAAVTIEKASDGTAVHGGGEICRRKVESRVAHQKARGSLKTARGKGSRAAVTTEKSNGGTANDGSAARIGIVTAAMPFKATRRISQKAAGRSGQGEACRNKVGLRGAPLATSGFSGTAAERKGAGVVAKVLLEQGPGEPVFVSRTVYVPWVDDGIYLEDYSSQQPRFTCGSYRRHE